jgi:hypothetical protein
MKSIYLLAFLLAPLLTFAKNNDKKTKKQKITVFASWGYNRSAYTKSNIHFKGENYNFTLKHTIAKDRQSPLTVKNYLNLSNLTIPQYNFAIGIVLPKNISITIGQDHMKYVVQQYSSSTIDGYIHMNNKFDGEYHDKTFLISPDFLQYEHTDGLNYVHATFNKEKLLIESKNKHSMIRGIMGVHTGVLIPRTDIKLMEYPEVNKFHLAGYGIGVNLGLRAQFLKYCFIRFDNKIGYINMPDVISREVQYTDRAKQHFSFTEFFISYGVQYSF